MRTLLLSTVALALLAAAPTANAAGWSRPFSHQAGKGAFVEPVPRVAVAPDGMSVASFAQRGYIYAVTGDARGRFGRLQRLGRWASIASVVAAGRDGAALVAWEARDGLRVAVRRRTGRRLTIRRLATSSNSAINDLAVQVDPRGGWFLLENEFSQKTRKNRVRAFTLRADGTPALAPQSLGQGSFGAEARPVRALAVDDRGYATAVFGTPDGVVAAQGVHQGHFGPLAPFGDRSITDPRVTASRDADGRPLVAATRIANCGDAGCFGQPVAARLDPTGRPLPFAVPALEHPGRAFGPSIAPLGAGAAALVFSLKSGPDAFSRLAPVKAVVVRDGAAPGALQTLTPKAAAEPVAATLSRDRVLVLWSGNRGFGAALAGADGTFRKTVQPPGPPPELYHTNTTNRAIATGGPYALVGWSRAGRVRLTLRRFG